MSQAKSKFQFNRFNVTESHYKFNEEGPYNLSVALNSSGIVFSELNQFQLNLDMLVEDEDKKFMCEVKTISMFDFPEEADIETMKSGLFTTNAPAIAFPYIRAYIANLTAQSGLLNIMLPTLNLSGLGKQLKEAIEVK